MFRRNFDIYIDLIFLEEYFDKVLKIELRRTKKEYKQMGILQIDNIVNGLQARGRAVITGTTRGQIPYLLAEKKEPHRKQVEETRQLVQRFHPAPFFSKQGK